MALPVIFFDIGDTLAVAHFGPDNSLERFEVFPFVLQILGKLKSTPHSGGQSLRLGVISNSGTISRQTLLSALSQSGLTPFFEPGLLLFSSVEGLDKSQPEFFRLAATRASSPPQRCIYVGENEKERAVAATAGFVVSFHALHLFHVLAGMNLPGRS